MKKTAMLLALTGALGMTSAAQATLFSRPGGMVYDDVLDITWLQDANLANQTFTWQNAVDWADTLIYGGYDDWRLASLSVSAGLPTGATFNPVFCDTATEQQCRDNELGYMFYHNLGGTFGDDKTGDQTVGGVILYDIQDFYWSGTENSPGDPFAWDFVFGDGVQNGGVKAARCLPGRCGPAMSPPRRNRLPRCCSELEWWDWASIGGGGGGDVDHSVIWGIWLFTGGAGGCPPGRAVF